MKSAPYFRPARRSWALLLLGIFIGVWLLSGPAGFGSEPRSAEAALVTELRKIVARDPGPDFFGWSVAVSGDTAVVGAVGKSSAGSFTGAAYIFQRNQDGVDYWGQVKKIHAYDAHGTDQFGISVAISGDTVVVGANGGDLAAIGAGAAYIFQRNAGGSSNWGQVKKLLASDAWEDDDFGWSVAVSGDTIVVGAYGKDTGATDAGAAYVFQRDEGGVRNWGEVTKILASDAQDFDRFGSSVAVSGDTAIVGADDEDGGSNDVGAAYIFERDEGGADNWGEVKKLSASDAHMMGHFGKSVAVSGDTATVGAPDAGYPFPMPGAAYVFERDEGSADNWGEVKKLSASDAGAYDQFGNSVAVSGDTAVVGAYARTGGSFVNHGGAYAFQRDQGGTDNWGEETKLTASDAAYNDYFGISVAVSGDITLVGAYHSNSTGAVYAFHEPTPTPTPTSTPAETPTATATDTPPPTATSAPTNTPTPTSTATTAPTNTPAPAGTATNTPTPALRPELIVTNTESADPIASGASFTYTIEVSNIGSAGADFIRLVDTPPAIFTYSGFSTTRGACVLVGSITGGTLDCDLGSFGTGPAAVATITINGVFTTAVHTTVGNTAVVDPDNVIFETNESNNSVTITTTVLAPTPTPAPTNTATPTAMATATDAPTNTPTATPTPTETPAMPPGSFPGTMGDVNCDGIMNSIDAALVLQFEAGLIDTLPCPDAADVNGDGHINSIDAALILQVGAGLTNTVSLSSLGQR